MNQNVFIAANHFAFKAHDGQVRQGVRAIPYICHPLEVANILARSGFSAQYDVLAAAMLHDVVEDCGYTIAEINEVFGDVIAGLVAELTFAKGDGKDGRLRRSRHFSFKAGAIKLADMISNINSLVEDPTAKSRDDAWGYVHHAQMMAENILDLYGHPLLKAKFDQAVLDFNLNYFNPND